MVTFWPRHEVFQLVIQQLANSGGKVLTNEVATAAVKQLSKLQTPEGNISFDRWLVVAKDLLRWNDSCLQVFWEMLLLALSCTKDDRVHSYDETGVDLAYLAIFLVLHTNDLQSRSSLPGSSYDTVWPDADSVLSPPSAPISSPSKIHGLNVRMLPISGPPSPKSPVGSPRSGGNTILMPTSPKRMSSMSPRQCKSASHYLYTIRQKLPIILRAVTIDDSALGSDNADSIALALDSLRGGAAGSGPGSSGGVLGARGLEFMVSRKAVDSLGLIMSGGLNRDDQARNISSLHPMWAEDTPQRASQSPLPSEKKYIPYSEVSEWLDSNLSQNDFSFPTMNAMSPAYSPAMGCVSPRFSQSSSPLGSCEELPNGNGSNSPNAHDLTILPYLLEVRPSRVINTISSLALSKPTVVMGCSTTIIHITVADERPSVKMKSDHRTDDALMNVSDEGRMNKGMSRRSTTSLSSAMSLSDQDQDIGGDNTDSYVESDGAMSEGLSADPTSEAVLGPTGAATGDKHRLRKPDLPGGRNSDKSSADIESDDRDSDSGGEGESYSVTRVEDGVDGLDALKGYSARRRRKNKGASAGYLPSLSVTASQGGYMHFLSAYSCVSITNCSDCEIVVGAVSGAVVLNSCERIKLTVACKKLIVQNCLECDLSVATLSASVIAGDSRSLIFGPFNTAYKHHRLHLKLAGLSALCDEDDRTGENSPYSAAKSNFWSSLCDINTCLESVSSSSSPSGYALDAADHSSFSQQLPPPPASTACLTPPDKFRFLAIPCRSEYIPIEKSCIAMPSMYLLALENRRNAVIRLNDRLEKLGHSAWVGTGSDSHASESKGLKNQKSESMKFISSKFTEWLITTDKVQHVLDLVKLDGERIVNTGNACRSADTCDALVSALVMRSDLFVDGRYAD